MTTYGDSVNWVRKKLSSKFHVKGSATEKAQRP